jgi:hypothetical protein
MNASTDLVHFVQLERTARIQRSALARLAACARACRSASTGVVQRLVRIVRPAPQSC